jgi:hypothetical protein
MNTLITELTVKNHINTLGGKNSLPDFLNIPFELDNGRQGNYKIKTGIERLNYFLKQLKTASKYYGQKTNRVSSGNSPENTIQIQAAFYVDQLKTSELLFYPLKKSMLATSNNFRLEVLRRIVPRNTCFSGNYSSDTNYLQALTEAALTMGYTINEYAD